MVYSGTYKQKKVIKLAPDAVVRINGRTTIQICPNPNCKGSIELSKYITSLSTSLANNTTIGNAQFTITMPRHGDGGSNMVRGGKVYGLNLMDEVEIFIKSRFTNHKDEYRYYKVFWGIISSIGESYNSGAQSVSVNCESMLKWLQLMKTNEHPAVMALNDTVSRTDMDAVFYAGKTYANKNPYQIIYSLVNVTMLNMVLPKQLDTEKGTTTAGLSPAEQAKKGAGWSGSKDILLLNRWRDNFSKIKGSLKMFGTSEDSFSDVADPKQSESRTKDDASFAGGKTKNTPIQIYYNSRALMDFKPFFKPDDAKQIDPITNVYKNNLEIVSEVKIMSGFEFYLDTTGDIIFKPPFWNVDTRNNPVFYIKDEDIINWDFQESDESIVTRVEVTGSLSQYINVDSYIVPRGIFTNYNWARQFGMRTEQITMRFFTSANMCYYHAISEMDRINADRYKGSLTIIGRPELRLGLPVYIESRDIFGYVDNISHNFSFGGPFQTTVHISAIRKKYLGEDPMSDGHYLEKKGGTPKTKNYKGDSTILLFQGQSEFAKEFYDSVENDLKAGIKNASETESTQSKTAAQKLRIDPNKLLKTNRSGVYKEVSLHAPAAQAALKLADNAKNQANRDSYLDFLDAAIPVSDEDGYELVGTYENGRSLYLDKNGTLRKKGKSFSEILSNSLNDVNNRDNTFTTMTIGEVTITGDKTDNAAWRKDYLNKTVDKNTNNAEAVKNYYKDKAISLADIKPKQDSIRVKGCSCHDPAISGVTLKDKLSTDSKQKTISNVNKGN